MTVSRKLKLVQVDRKSGIDVTESINGKTIEYRGKQLKIKM